MAATGLRGAVKPEGRAGSCGVTAVMADPGRPGRPVVPVGRRDCSVMAELVGRAELGLPVRPAPRVRSGVPAALVGRAGLVVTAGCCSAMGGPAVSAGWGYWWGRGPGQRLGRGWCRRCGRHRRRRGRGRCGRIVWQRRSPGRQREQRRQRRCRGLRSPAQRNFRLHQQHRFERQPGLCDRNRPDDTRPMGLDRPERHGPRDRSQRRQRPRPPHDERGELRRYVVHPRPGGQLPDAARLQGARIFLSEKQPLYIAISPDNKGWAGPNPANPADPNYSTVYDWYEMTFKNGAVPFGGNTTQVDQFGLPFSVTVTQTPVAFRAPVAWLCRGPRCSSSSRPPSRPRSSH